MPLSPPPLATLLLAVVMTLAATSPAALADPEVRATVLSIGDGDTIRVQQGGKRITIRLACIDAPEMAQSPDGANARRYLQTRLRLGSSVTLRPQTVDRYGRTVAEVIGEVNLNLALVEDGMAFAYRKYLGQCDAKEYLDAEFRASRSRTGVWRVPGGITRPWDFRRGRSSGRFVSGTTSIPGGRRYRCSEIGSFARAQELLRQGHTYLDGNGDGEACESLR
ncbi:thermonuclease family protein [Synechococcus sp. J7-Johnson]|uniref:thermonuclease family protein n=1 Tax=Synechococcus sp. J7-Johnson TaxID=2823737 RepID=UPI0020CDB8BF|nr:thermonuclease family protein [Synechococcus sp. J7-Johnson]MCP9840169.1 thermonuclease family protein [Synechococcus sp. J7-Johnson]